MYIASYTPKLTPEEAQRFWMTPVEVCRLAAVGEASDPKVKKLLNTLSDRGHVPFVKSGAAKTAPRLYSLVSAAMLRTIWDVIEDGRTYRYAEPVAQAVADALLKGVARFEDLIAMDVNMGNAQIIFAGMKDDGTPRTLRWAQKTISGGLSMAFSVYEAGYLIQRICGIYADFWADDLKARNLLDEVPFEIGLDGWPVEEGGV
ncbi:hypothetical protein [Gemmobacter sp. LW-1]|uniref:hypothetical protein n=1 Tax=Gemmobacter sp. LW-1 TaxID=1529005 RepID=UPI0006C73C19|nr:hypothetical protein [Gemmobacter sp. LW-1]